MFPYTTLYRSNRKLINDDLLNNYTYMHTHVYVYYSKVIILYSILCSLNFLIIFYLFYIRNIYYIYIYIIFYIQYDIIYNNI